jgi:hypothetical protein
MKWMRERDLLIAQTMAFVQSVTGGKKPDAEQPVAYAEALGRAASPAMPDIEAMLAEAIGVPMLPKPIQPMPSKANEVLHPAEVSRPALPLRSEYQSEIQARVANFRAHQQRFLKEREDYCTRTMAKVQASLQQHAPQPRPSK